MPSEAGPRIVLRERCRCMRRTLIQMRGHVRRSTASGSSRAGGSVDRAQTAIRKIHRTRTVAPLAADVQSAVIETINAYAA